MAKKVISKLKEGSGKKFSRVIKMVKSSKTGAYKFKEEIVHLDKVKDFFTKK